MTITRREAMKHGGKAVAAAAVLSALPSIARAKEDAELLSRIEAFWAAHKGATDTNKKWLAEAERVEALPGCPPLTYPTPTEEDWRRWRVFMRSHGIDALADAANKANKRQGKAVKAAFDTPAKTCQGVLAKLKIVEVAYGNGESGGDVDLECWQDQDAPWLENAIGDFERLIGRAV